MSKDLTNLWLQTLVALAPQVPRGQFITFFKDTAVLGLEDNKLIVGLPLPSFLNWHLEHYQEMTLAAAKELDSSVHQIIYKVDVSLKDMPDKTINLLEHFPEKKKRKQPGKQEVKLPTGVVSKILNNKYNLSSFVVGGSNRLAHAACQAVAADPGGKYNPLFLYGDVGLGKTHLLQAVGNSILQRNPNAAVVYTTSEEFTNQVVEGISKRNMDKIRKKYRSVDVLIIDDIQFITNKERTQEEFFHTFNTLYEAQKQIIISADRQPSDLQLESRLVSRFEKGMIADLSPPDYETKLVILTHKARELELFIDPNVLGYIAEHTTKNIRELEGILMQVMAQYELEQQMPTVKSVSEIMKKLNKDVGEQESMTGFTAPPKRAVTFQDVLETVSSYYTH